MGFRSYAIALVLATAGLVAAMGAINVLVDPYGLFDLVRIDGVNAKKSESYTHTRLAKQVRALRLRPTTVLLGNSRTDVGFDPQSPKWPAEMRPVANIGIPGEGLDKLATSYAFVASRLQPETIYIGLDFFDFLSAAPPPAPARPPAEASSDGDVMPVLAETVFSTSALLDSAKTVLAQPDRFSTEMTAAGFNPMQNFVHEVELAGQWAMVHSKNQQHAGYLRNRTASITQANGEPATPLIHLRHILRDAARRGQRLVVFTYPMHGHFYAMLAEAGRWALFEEWKRAVLAEWRAARALSPDWQSELWDFALLTPETTEPAPLPGRQGQRMRWYWEPGHFKAALGERLIAQMTGAQPAGLGVRLDHRLAEQHLERQRRALDAYQRAHPEDFAYIQELCRRSQCSRP